MRKKITRAYARMRRSCILLLVGYQLSVISYQCGRAMRYVKMLPYHP